LGRAASATPAVGSKHAHKDEQEEIITAAIGPMVGATAKDAHHSAGNGKPDAHVKAVKPAAASRVKVPTRR
jgi:hypothetical protein